MRRRLALAAAALWLAAFAGPAKAQAPNRPPGITPEIEKAIQRGLAYLDRTQAPDGTWRNNGSYGAYPAAMTALALTALLASGSTSTQGPHAQAVRKGVEAVIRSQQQTGLLTAPNEQRSMYGHGFSMLALAEAYGGEGSVATRRRIHRVLTKAAQLTQRSQSTKGGWNYTPTSRGDEGSVTITQLQALRACRNAGIKVPKSVIDRAVGYIRNSQCSDGGIAYRAGQRGSSRPSISAAAICSLYSAGVYEGPMIDKLLPYVKQRVPPSLGGGHAYYTQLYMAQGMWLAGEEHWKGYGPKMFQLLLPKQSADGSWADGRVGSTYSTAIACIILQLPYRHLPIHNR